MSTPKSPVVPSEPKPNRVSPKVAAVNTIDNSNGIENDKHKKHEHENKNKHEQK